MQEISVYIEKYAKIHQPELRIKKAAQKAAEEILGTEIPIERIRVKNGAVQFMLSSTARAELFLHKTKFDALFEAALAQAGEISQT
jgi:hypothetical protein